MNKYSPEMTVSDQLELILENKLSKAQKKTYETYIIYSATRLAGHYKKYKISLAKETELVNELSELRLRRLK